MEARRINPDETETFLELLCEVFGLDYSRAHGIFFNEPMFDLQRKWGLFEGARPVSILTTVPLQFGWGRAIGIAGVATVERRRGQGLATQLLEHVLREAEAAGEGAALLFARARGLYERSGFQLLDEVVRGHIAHTRSDDAPDVLPFEQVHDLYAAWACNHEARLRRDEQRWKYWRWTLRMCVPMPGGYACMEGGLLRECVVDGPQTEWPIGRQTDWLGLSTMADLLGLDLRAPRFDLYLMGYNMPMLPQMFMTDQF